MIKAIIKKIILFIFLPTIVLCVFAMGLYIWGDWYDQWSGYNAGLFVSDGVCNIAVIPIFGSIIPYPGADEDGSGYAPPPSTNSSDTLYELGRAEADPNIKGVLAYIDSPGGYPAASEMISNGFKKTTLPVAALIIDTGASGAYLIATGADTIIASPFSNVGSIGVTSSYIDTTEHNKNEGLQFISLSTGKFKDSGNPNKPLTEEERALFERDLEITHGEFMKQVAENRHIPMEVVAMLADGSTMPGALALENKLIDTLGDKETARTWFAEQLHLSSEDVIFCR